MNFKDWLQPAGYGLLAVALAIALYLGVHAIGHKTTVAPLPHLKAPVTTPIKPKVLLPKPAPQHKQVPKPKAKVQKQQSTSTKPTVSGCFPVCPLNINPWAQAD